MNDVYLITNRVNGKRYVGITCRGYQVRFSEHVSEALAGSTTILHNAIRKYGPENFDVILLETNVSDSEAAEKEMYYIKLYNTFYTSRIGYNMTEGGGGMTGYKHTEEAKRKISESGLGKTYSAERNEKIRQAMLGREYKEEWRVALSQSRLGRFKQEENPFFGKHHSELTKQQISTANTKHHVLRLDPLTKEVLEIHNNATAAGLWIVENGYSTACYTTCEGRISEVCRRDNIKSTAYGFSWRFDERSID